MSFKAVATSLLTSKKVITAIAGVLTLIGVRYLKLDEATVGPLSLQITVLVAGLLVGQGAADLGKASKDTEMRGVIAITALEHGFTQQEEDGDE